MTLIEDAEKWAWQVAVKKIIVGILGFLASQKAVAGLAWLQAHGISVNIDPTKFQTEFTALGIGGFIAAHDWMKLKFPESKWI